MIITADFGALTRITEVILKKYNYYEYDKDIVKKFKLELKSDDKWLQHGEYETGIKKEDDYQKAHHIKLERPVISSQVRIVIEDDMVTDPYNMMGRVGFVAARPSADQLLIKRAIDDLVMFKQADQVSKLSTTWFGLEIFTRSEAFRMASFESISKGFDDDWSSEIKYFNPDSSIFRSWNKK